jgi:hypothetical protein
LVKCLAILVSVTKSILTRIGVALDSRFKSLQELIQELIQPLFRISHFLSFDPLT